MAGGQISYRCEDLTKIERRAAQDLKRGKEREVRWLYLYLMVEVRTQNSESETRRRGGEGRNGMVVLLWERRGETTQTTDDRRQAKSQSQFQKPGHLHSILAKFS